MNFLAVFANVGEKDGDAVLAALTPVRRQRFTQPLKAIPAALRQVLATNFNHFQFNCKLTVAEVTEAKLPDGPVR